MKARDFLDLIRGPVHRPGESSADRPVKLGRIDPAYSTASFPGTLPLIKFDGEDAVSGKRYAVMYPYRPQAGDRVVLVPVGTTYVIIGSVTQTAATYEGAPGMAPVRVVEGTDLVGISATAGTPGSPVCGTTFIAPPTGRVYITVRGTIRSGSDQRATNLSYEVREGGVIGSGTVVPAGAVAQEKGLTVGRAVNASAPAELTASNRDLLTGLTPGATYNVRTMHWVSGGSGGSIDYRALLIEPA